MLYEYDMTLVYEDIDIQVTLQTFEEIDIKEAEYEAINMFCSIESRYSVKC